MNIKRVVDWKAQRRQYALEMKREGLSQREIAAALQVSEGAVSRWMSLAEREGERALQGRVHPGAAPKLAAAQLQRLPKLLERGAPAYGFRGERWTCARVAQLIEQEFGVHYHKGHVARLLKGLGWTPQRPIERASQRDEAAIERWRRRRWTQLKKKRSGKAE